MRGESTINLKFDLPNWLDRHNLHSKITHHVDQTRVDVDEEPNPGQKVEKKLNMCPIESTSDREDV